MSLTLGHRSPLAIESIVAKSIKDGLQEAGRARAYNSDPTQRMPRMGGPDASRNGVLSFATMRRIFRQNDLVRSVVLTKIRQIVSLDFDIQRADEVRFTPPGLARALRKLFVNPNTDRQGWTAFLTELLTDALVLDAGVVEKVRNASGEVVELVTRDGATFVPKVDEHRRLKGYEQCIRDWRGEEKRIYFKPEDIVYLRFNPTSDSIWGVSPIESLAIAIGGDILAMNRNVQWLADGNLLDNVLVLGRVGAAALEQFRAFFEENGSAMGKLPILGDVEAGGIDPKLFPLRQTNRDMQFIELDRWIFQRVCAGFQVAPDDVIPLESHATKAAADQQGDVSKSKGLRPECAIIEDRFTVDVVQEFHPNLRFKFVQNDKTDQNEEAMVWGTLFRNGGVLNELRKKAGLQPILGPMVDIDGRMVNSYDLPINTFTGLPFGVEAANPFADAFGGGDPTSDDGEGGDPSGDPFKSLRAAMLLRATKGRRRSPGEDPARRALAAYELHRAQLARRAEARVRRLGVEDAFAFGSAVPAPVPGPDEGGSLSR